MNEDTVRFYRTMLRSMRGFRKRDYREMHVMEVFVHLNLASQLSAKNLANHFSGSDATLLLHYA